MSGTVAGFERRQCVDRLGRRITFYVADGSPNQPMIVYIQGSGCHSLFVKRGVEIRPRQHGILAAVVAGRATVLAIEKPGVQFLDNPPTAGSAESCRQRFLREHTLDRWVSAIDAAVDMTVEIAARAAMPVVLIGQSEGATVAAALARRRDDVSHVALLSGNGPSQLFDLLYGELEADQDGAETIDVFKRIEREPDQWRAMAWGHPHRRWSSFLATSTLEELLGTSARVLIVHGKHDQVVPVAAARLLFAELLRHKRDVHLIERDAGHDLRVARQTHARTLRDVFAQVVDWALPDFS